MLRLDWDLSELVLLSKILLEHHFYCVSNWVLCQIKAGMSQIYFRKKISYFHEPSKCQKLSFAMKSAYIFFFRRSQRNQHVIHLS